MLAGDGMKSITPLVLLGFLIVSYLNRPGSRAFPVISKLLCRERSSFYPPKPGAAAPNHETYATADIPAGWPQCEQRRALIGISPKHWEHFFLVGSAEVGALRIRETSALIGVITKK